MFAKCAWEKIDQANIKNVSGKAISNNCAECACEIDLSIYKNVCGKMTSYVILKTYLNVL